MGKITYKYNVGDLVRFKKHFHSSASCGLDKLAGSVARITQVVDYGKPTYCLEDHDGVFSESCFEGLAVEPVDSAYHTFTSGPNKD